MNKIGSLQAFVNQAFVIAVIIFIIFLLVGSGGGFVALTKIGKLLGLIPIWGWAILGGLILFSLIRK